MIICERGNRFSAFSNSGFPMTSEQIAARLKDDKIKTAYLAAVRGRKTGKKATELIDMEELKVIWKKATDFGTINKNEEADLELLAANADMSDKVRERLKADLKKWADQKADHMHKDRLRGKDLAPVIDMLKEHTSSQYMKFTSPSPATHYAPSMYRTIANLIVDGKIAVFEYDHGKEGEEESVKKQRGGTYKHKGNELLLLRGQQPVHRRAVLIHEATHAIQDYLNVGKAVKYIEADAYIAQTLVYLTYGSKLKKTDLFKAAGKVAQGLRVPSPVVDSVAYDELVAAITVHPLYKEKAEEIRFPKSSKDHKKDEIDWDWYSPAK